MQISVITLSYRRNKSFHFAFVSHAVAASYSDFEGGTDIGMTEI